MKTIKELDFEEMPMRKLSKVQGGTACNCSDNCSCYFKNDNATRTSNATDTAEVTIRPPVG